MFECDQINVIYKSDADDMTRLFAMSQMIASWIGKVSSPASGGGGGGNIWQKICDALGYSDKLCPLPVRGEIQTYETFEPLNKPQNKPFLWLKKLQSLKIQT